MTAPTDEEILRELKREIGLRHNVYPRQVANGRMTKAMAAKQIHILEFVAASYERKIKARTPDMFAEPGEEHDPLRAMLVDEGEKWLRDGEGDRTCMGLRVEGMTEPELLGVCAILARQTMYQMK